MINRKIHFRREPAGQHKTETSRPSGTLRRPKRRPRQPTRSSWRPGRQQGPSTSTVSIAHVFLSYLKLRRVYILKRSFDQHIFFDNVQDGVLPPGPLHGVPQLRLLLGLLPAGHHGHHGHGGLRAVGQTDTGGSPGTRRTSSCGTEGHRWLTRDTEDYELWDRRTQVAHQGHGGLRAVGQKDTGGAPWTPRTISCGTEGHR